MNGVWMAVGGFVGATLGTILTGYIVEWYRQKNRLRLAAIDKRLEVNQEAYTFSVNLWISTTVGNEEGTSDIREEGFEWWTKNCLYLSKESSQEFAKVCLSTNTDPDQIFNVCRVIRKETGLPNLIEKELFSVAAWRKPTS